jgi:hypothetical protein
MSQLDPPVISTAPKAKGSDDCTKKFDDLDLMTNGLIKTESGAMKHQFVTLFDTLVS